MPRKILSAAGGAAVVVIAFAFTLSVIDRGFGATFHSILIYINP
jgi:hypothetical protein